MSRQLSRNDVIQAGLRRLKAMGLTAYIQADENNECFIFVTVDSVCKLIKSEIKFQNTSVSQEAGCIVVHAWRSCK